MPIGIFCTAIDKYPLEDVSKDQRYNQPGNQYEILCAEEENAAPMGETGLCGWWANFLGEYQEKH